MSKPSDMIMRFFKSEHLPPDLRPISGDCEVLAQAMAIRLPEDPEKTAGLRKLLEAKDCFVRAAIAGRDEEPKG